jgi:acyl-coenzyme A thioesterase PaaI-like protein
VRLVHWVNKCPPAWRAPLVRFGFNWHPAYRRTGGRVEYVAPDLRSMRVRLPFNHRTRNMVGTIFGGFLFAVTDGPHPMLLALALGRDYVLWDKAASIAYRRPARTTLYAEFSISPEEIAEVKNTLSRQPKLDIDYRVALKDRKGVVYSEVVRTVYIANKKDYKQKSST